MATGALVTHLLETSKHPEHGYRACLSLLTLSKRFGKPQLEAVCMVALAIAALAEMVSADCEQDPQQHFCIQQLDLEFSQLSKTLMVLGVCEISFV